jgi:DNA-binding MarR family transcriptional regulator
MARGPAPVDHTPAALAATPIDRVAWATELIRLEIALWARVDARLWERHEISLAFFETLYFVRGAPDGGMRVGDLARALGVSVGGASKLVDRVEHAGLVARQPDPVDRRAARVTLTPAGKRKLTASTKTYDAEVELLLDRALNADEQQQIRGYMTRLLTSIDEPGRAA